RFGDSPNTIDGPFGNEPLVAAGLRFNPTSLWILACTAFVTLAVIAFLRGTRLGRAMRAVSVNAEAARLMGIRVESVYRWSWAMRTAIGALAGLLVAPLIGINPEIGQLILRGLLGAVIGGFTSIPGAIVGGVAVGLIETYSGVLIGSTFKNLVPFILLMVLLVFRPQGLFGAAEIKRVLRCAVQRAHGNGHGSGRAARCSGRDDGELPRLPPEPRDDQ